VEEIYEGKLKKIVGEYESEISKKNEIIQELELNASGRQ